jgi:dTDP-glucose 4,6-dehydratase
VRWYLDNQEWLDNITSGDYEKYYEKMYGNR